MWKKSDGSIGQRVICAAAVAVAVAGLLAFVLAPAIVVRPESFGLDGSLEVGLEYTLPEVWSGLASMEKKLNEGMATLDGYMQELPDFLTGSLEEPYQNMKNAVEQWLCFPLVFMAAFAAAVLGFALAAVFGVVGFFRSGKRGGCLWMISVGGAVHLLASLTAGGWFGWLLGQLAAFTDALADNEFLSMEKLLGFQISFSGSMPGAMFRCVGIGLAAAWICAAVLIVLGILAARSAARVPGAKRTAKRTAKEQKQMPHPAQTDQALGGGIKTIQPPGIVTGTIRLSEAGMETVQPSQTETVRLSAAGMETVQPSGAGRMTVLTGEYAGWEIPLKAGETLRIGRDPGTSQLVLSDPLIAPVHCSVVYRPSGIGGAYAEYEIRSHAANGVSFDGGLCLSADQAARARPGTRFYLADGKNSFFLA